MSVYQHVYKALGYDPIHDFAPLSQVATFDFAIAVGPQVPAKSLKELVAWVKANPNQGTYGIPAAGSLPHFFGVLFGNAAGLDPRHVGYRGSAAALTDLVAGQIPIVVTTTSPTSAVSGVRVSVFKDLGSKFGTTFGVWR